MTYRYLPGDLAERLRAAGLTVVEIDGWQARGRPASTGGFAPVGHLNHHTGSLDREGDPADDLAYAKWLAFTGRPDLSAPLVQTALSLEGIVYVLAAGRSNHAGTAKASGSVAAGDGNSLYSGTEWMLSGTQPIPAKMMAAGATLNAVMLGIYGSSSQAVSCHYQTSVTGKWDIGDPNGIPFQGHKVLDVPKFRSLVDKEIARLKTPVEPLVQDHLSGRFTASGQEEEGALDEMMDGSHLVTTTEVDALVRSKHLHEPGWWSVYGDKGPRDDCGIAGKISRLKLLHGETVVLSDRTYQTERGTQSSKTVGAFAAVQDRVTGEIGIVAAVHTPHGMQDELRTGNIRSDVAKAYRDIIKGLRKTANKWARKWKATWVNITGDWNVNVKRPWVQAYLKAQFPRYTLNWKNRMPAGGTWGKMIFDASMLRGIKVGWGPRLLPRFKGFDHRGYEQGLV